MSTDGTGEPPLTRAQLRAQRAAQDAAEQAPVEQAPVEQAPAWPEAVEQAPAQQVPVEHAPVVEAPINDEPPVAPVVESVAETPAAEPVIELVAEPVAEQPPASATPPVTDRRPAPPRSNRRFALALGAVLGILALVVGVLGVVSLTQGPRLSEVQVDPSEAIESSGSRVILTANQSLSPIEPEQVTVEPAVPFTIDASGRSVGVRFTVPLDDETKYQVSVSGVTAVGGGPSSDLSTTFTTPASQLFLLQRSVDGDDKIFMTDLSGEKATPVFAHPRIDDFRATPDHLVVAVEDEQRSQLLVMKRDGSDQRELDLPGEGSISSVQVSDRAGLVGYSYSDLELTEDSGRASVLVTQPLSGAGEPRIVQIDGAEASVGEWQFVPDSSSLLFIDFNGALSVEDPTTDAGVQPMGIAASILGVSRGTYTAIVERADASVVELNLADGSEVPLTASDPDYGDPTSIETFPGGTLRHIVQRDDTGMPTGQAVVKVDDDSTATVITEVSGADSILQVCASPSGQYAAVVIAPDLPTNDYDAMMLPLPTTLHTQLIDLRGDQKMPTLSGFDISWCRSAPQ